MSDETAHNSSKNKLGLTAAEAAELAEAAAKAAAAKAAAEAEAEKEYEAAAGEAVATSGQTLVDKRGQERIFRREMGEPEFFRYKKDLVPTLPILTEDDIKEI